MQLFTTLSNMASHELWRLQHDPTDLFPAAVRMANFTNRAIQVELGRRLGINKSRFVVHAAIHTTGNNIGDMALPFATRKSIDHSAGQQPWYLHPLWRNMDNRLIDTFNERATLMVVGGGGLFLPHDDKPSGWHWNISQNTLGRLQTPMCVFAVGFNKFRGQDDFKPEFRDHVELTAQKSIFIGLRNSESAERLSDYLSPQARTKLRVQPCCTTVLSRFYPTYKASLRQPNAKELAINAAFDRSHLRFGNGQQAVDTHMKKLAEVAKWAYQHGWRIHLTYHSFEDAHFATYMKHAGVPFERHWLPRMNPEEVFDLYTRIPLVLGMRGHAQMIPYGLGNMIIPVITHDKLVYFLKEIGKPNWGVELLKENALDELIFRIEHFEENRETYYKEIETTKSKLWLMTTQNISELKSYMVKPT